MMGLTIGLVALLAGCGKSNRAEAISESGQTETPAAKLEPVDERWEDSDRLRDILELIHLGDREGAASMIVEERVTSASSQLSYMVVAACDPGMLEFLIDTVGVDPSIKTERGTGVVHELTFPYGEEELGMPPVCSADVQAASMEILLKGGADPCAAPFARPDDHPAVHAAEWGVEPTIVSMLQPYSNDCG